MHYLHGFPYSLDFSFSFFHFRDEETEAQGYCDLPGVTQLNWRPDSEVLPFSPWHCLPGDIWQYRQVFLIVTIRGGGAIEVLLLCGGWRPGMPLNTLECTDSPNKKAAALVSTVLRLRSLLHAVLRIPGQFHALTVASSSSAQHRARPLSHGSHKS